MLSCTSGKQCDHGEEFEFDKTVSQNPNETSFSEVSNCGSDIAILYFVSFVFLSSFLVRIPTIRVLLMKYIPLFLLFMVKISIPPFIVTFSSLKSWTRVSMMNFVFFPPPRFEFLKIQIIHCCYIKAGLAHW